MSLTVTALRCERTSDIASAGVVGERVDVAASRVGALRRASHVQLTVITTQKGVVGRRLDQPTLV